MPVAEPTETQPLLRGVERSGGGWRSNGTPGTAIEDGAHPDAPLGGGDDDYDNGFEVIVNGDAHGHHVADGRNGGSKVDVFALAPLRWLPARARKGLMAAGRWCRGPAVPREWRIEPIFPAVQHFPLLILERLVPRKRHRLGLYVALVTLWFVSFAVVLRKGMRATTAGDWGVPSAIGCGNTYWLPGNGCGLDGNNCRPFNGTGFAFRCPANCESYRLLNYRAVGAQEVIYRPLVVGGPPDGDSAENGTGSVPGNAVYRGDSFICGAAIHAGIVSNAVGGCGVVKTVGRAASYPASTRNGITSIEFDAEFPLSFTFEGSVACKATDPRWALLAISVVFSTLLSLFTADPGVFFFTIFTGLFFHVGLASDPPPAYSTADRISDVLGKFLPAAFVAWVMFDRMGVRRTLRGLTAQIEKTVLWLGACWVGALSNYTFEWIPISRLTDHDLNQQPGAKLALAIIVVLLTLIVAKQIWFFRQEGRLIPYLRLYTLFLVGILLSLRVPDLKLRIHHYVLALLLLPGTAMQTRPALLYQGLLVGLFINGIARWGFDPVLQTVWALRADSPNYSPLPVILPPVISANGTAIAFTWEPPPGPRYDGISVLVNDVERFRGYFDDTDRFPSLPGVRGPSFVWRRPEDRRNVTEYFRFGYMQGSQSWDYTRAGIWRSDGEWEHMEAGPSLVSFAEDRTVELVKRR